MLSFMRRHAKSWLIKLALIAIVIVFVSWGIGSLREERVAAVAYVDGRPITVKDYDERYRQLIESYRRRLKGELSEELLKALNLKQQVLDTLIYERLLVWAAERLNMELGADDLKAIIESDPTFQREGKFDRELYRKMVETNPKLIAKYEQQVEESLIGSRVASLISGFAKVSEGEIFDFYRHQNQKIDLHFAVFKPGMYISDVQVSDEEISDYYSKHKEHYRVPPQVRVGYIGFRYKDFENQVSLTEQNLKEYFSAHKDEPPFAKAKAFHEVREKIVSLLKKERSRELALNKVREVYGDLIMEQDLEKVAKTKDLPFKQTDFFGQIEPPEPFASDRRFADTAFALNKKEISHILELPHAYFVIQVIDKKESFVPDLEVVLEKVRKDLVNEKSEEMALTHAQDFLEDLREGKDISQLAEAYNLDIEETGLFRRLDPIPKIGNNPEIKEAAFSLSYENPYPDKVYKAVPGYFVFRLKKKEDVTKDMFVPERDRFKEKLLFQKTQGILDEWLLDLRKRANVKIMKEILAF